MKIALCAACVLCACNRPDAPSSQASASVASSAAASASVSFAREACARGDCRGEIVARLQAEVSALALADGRVFIGTRVGAAASVDTIWILDAPAAAPKALAGGLDRVTAMEVADGYVYFVEMGLLASQLQRIPLSGGKAELLASRVDSHTLALTSHDVVFRSRLELRALPRAGGSARVVGHTGASIGVVTRGDTIYWTTEEGVLRSNHRLAERVVSASDLLQLAVTPEYLVLQKIGKEPGVLRARHDGSDVRLLYGGDVRALAADSRYAFILSGEDGMATIRRIALEDGEQTLLARRPSGWTTLLAIDETHVYFTDTVERALVRVRK